MRSEQPENAKSSESTGTAVLLVQNGRGSRFIFNRSCRHLCWISIVVIVVATTVLYNSLTPDTTARRHLTSGISNLKNLARIFNKPPRTTNQNDPTPPAKKDQSPRNPQKTHSVKNATVTVETPVETDEKGLSPEQADQAPKSPSKKPLVNRTQENSPNSEQVNQMPKPNVEVLEPVITVVTALFDIGPFQKGAGRANRTIEVYREWMTVWKWVKSPVIFYTDSARLAKEFEEIRSAAPYGSQTLTVVMDLKKGTPFPMWSMRLLPRISEIFRTPGYPHHPPNTVVPMYSVVMSGKYDVLEHTIRTNPFRTEYFAWLDIGVYRDMRTRNNLCVQVGLPPDFDESRIAMTETFAFKPDLSAEDIVRGNEVWVCGAAAFGRGKTFLAYIKQYRRTMVEMIARGWISTDQQTIYAMFSDKSLKMGDDLLPVKLQLYNANWYGPTKFPKNEWFYLGYLALKPVACTMRDLKLHASISARIKRAVIEQWRQEIYG